MTTANSPEYWNKATAHLSKKDKVMKKIIEGYSGEFLKSRGDAFFSLARAIVGQQVSVKAADTIWNRLMMAVGGEMRPHKVLPVSTELLRSVGLSGQKTVYLQGLAKHFHENPDIPWQAMSDEEVTKHLTALKGIGQWSAEMFLIFHLSRPDVFPLADIGLQKALFRHYNGGEKLTKAEMEKLGEKWQPYRSVATWYLWRSLDPVPVEY